MFIPPREKKQPWPESVGTARKIKVFCFFSSEKKDFLYFLPARRASKASAKARMFFSEEKNQKTFASGAHG